MDISFNSLTSILSTTQRPSALTDSLTLCPSSFGEPFSDSYCPPALSSRNIVHQSGWETGHPNPGKRAIDEIFMVIETSEDIEELTIPLENLRIKEDFLRTDKDGRTILHAAAACGKEAFVKAILERAEKVSVDLEASCLIATDRLHKTPLYLACEKKHPSVVKALVRVARGHAIYNKMLSTTNQYWDRGNKPRRGYTPFFLCCRNRDFESMKALFEVKSNTYFSSEFGTAFPGVSFSKRPFYLACSNGDTELLDVLLEISSPYRFSFDQIANFNCGKGGTPAHLLLNSRKGDEESKIHFLKKLIVSRPDCLGKQDASGRTLFELVRCRVSKEIFLDDEVKKRIAAWLCGQTKEYAHEGAALIEEMCQDEEQFSAWQKEHKPFLKACRSGNASAARKLLATGKKFGLRSQMLESIWEVRFFAGRRLRGRLDAEILKVVFEAAAEDGAEALEALVKRVRTELANSDEIFGKASGHLQLFVIIESLLEHEGLFEKIFDLDELVDWIIICDSQDPQQRDMKNYLLEVVERVYKKSKGDLLIMPCKDDGGKWSQSRLGKKDGQAGFIDKTFFDKMMRSHREGECQWWLEGLGDEQLRQLLLRSDEQGGCLHLTDCWSTPILVGHGRRLGILEEMLTVTTDKGQRPSELPRYDNSVVRSLWKAERSVLPSRRR